MNYSKEANKLRKRIGKFLGELSQGLPKPAQKFITQMGYGIQAAQSVILTEVARALEEPISIKKTEERLSRQLAGEKIGGNISESLLRQASGRIGENTLLIIDPGDIQKKYAEKMDYLARVRDGSEGIVGNGYWTMNVLGTEVDSKEFIPLYKRLYSQNAPDFVSENAEILKAVGKISKETGNKGIWVIDRGGDRDNLLLPLIDESKRFLIRSVGSRHMLCGGEKQSVKELAEGCKYPYREVIVKYEDGKEKVYEIEFGFRRVRLPERPARPPLEGAGGDKQLYLLVIRGLGEHPLMLLTNIPLRRSRKLLFKMVRSYLKRWSIEETIRFVKQSYDLENVRVLGYRSLQNLMPIVLAICYFVSVVLESSNKLKIMAGFVFKAAKRVFGIPDFNLYAISDGLSNIFTRHPGRPKVYSPRRDDQLPLFFDLGS